MLVDINLLQKKEKKASFFLIFILVGVIVLIAAGIFAWKMYQTQVAKEKQLETMLSQYKEEKVLKEQSLSKAESDNGVERLKAAIAWAEEADTSTSFLLQHITSLLPERGYFMNFSFAEGKTADLSIQFDSSREAAFYLKSLQNSPYIDEAELLSIETESISFEEDIVEEENVLPRYMASYRFVVNEKALQEGEGSP
ncbi:PilN domain-containing protein [Peribacillus asahii]|uniref:PilN domain-containing protein n=1 Tax=Peribacillus asahii TaxID=228899 RepID=UPI002079E8C9|nr:PilN domain-containing protein [Peribacillus asahii]USK58970.1 PilN domain-containing protein [Peribacillus asahii]